MASVSQIKFVKSLQQKKFRDLHGVFVAEGDKIVADLGQSNLQVEQLIATSKWLETNGMFVPEGTLVVESSQKDLERMSGLKSPPCVIAVIRKPSTKSISQPAPGKVVLALDTIQDPGNLGTMIRTADWFGIDQVVCSNETADYYNAKVIQATMGSFARVDVFYTNLHDYLLAASRIVNVFGATLQGVDIGSVQPANGGVLLIGNESHGISPRLRPLVSHEVQIRGGDKALKAESLNASVAAGIMMAWMSGAFS